MLKVLLAIACASATLAAADAGWSDQPPIAPNGGEHGTNCVGRNSSAATHNGAEVRDQAHDGLRSELVHDDRAATECGTTPYPSNPDVGANPGEHGTNCVGRNSSAVTGNGQVVREQAHAGERSTLVHDDRAAGTCGQTPSP